LERNNEQERVEKPIGYWLREADRAITAAVDRNLLQFNLTRRHWQVLNTIAEGGGIAKDDVLRLLRHFLDAFGLDEILKELDSRKWIAPDKDPEAGGERLRLTEEGKAAHAEILAAQQNIRMRLFRGVTEEEYRTVLKVLRQVAENAKEF